MDTKEKITSTFTKGEDGAFYYRGRRATNFSIVRAIKYKVLDEEGGFHNTLYEITVFFADSGKERCYVSTLGDIEGGSFFKIQSELSIFAEKTRLICKLIAEFILDIATCPKDDITYILTMGWFCYRGRYYYLGRDGAIERLGFTANVKSMDQEAIPLRDLYQNQVCEQIDAVNRLMGSSWEDRVLFLSVLASVLDGILQKRPDYNRTGLMIVGAKGSGKTSLVKGWFGAQKQTSVITSGGSLQPLIEAISAFRDWHFIVDDLALESLTKEKAIKNLTETVQSYHDGKPIGLKRQIINAKPIYTTERLLGRASVIERCIVIELDNYINRDRALAHLDQLDMSKEQIYTVVLSFIQWIASILDEGRFEAEFDVCVEEARVSMILPGGNVRIKNMIVNLYALHLLWLKYCSAKASSNEFDNMDIQNWILYLKRTYSYMVLTVSSRQDVLKNLFIKYIQESQQNIWAIQENERIDNLGAVAIDEDSGQVGVYIADVKGLFEYSNMCEQGHRSILLLDCGRLESGINEVYKRELPHTGEVFTQMEIKKILRASGWMLTRPRSGNDGTNYTFTWISRCGHGKATDELKPIIQEEFDDMVSFIGMRKAGKSTDFYIRQQTCIAIYLDKEIGKAVKWATLQAQNDRRDGWRTFCFKDEKWTEKLCNTLSDISSSINKGY